MTQRVLTIVLAICIVAYSFGTWWNIHQMRLALEPILNRMVAECEAGSTADYCKPR